MKKIILIIIAAALFASCSKKQDAAPVIKLTPQTATIKDITGKWTITADTIYATTNGQTISTIQPTTSGTYYQFNADGTGAIGTSAGAAGTVTYTLAAGVIDMHVNAGPNTSAGDVTLNIRGITATNLLLRIAIGTTYGDVGLTKN